MDKINIMWDRYPAPSKSKHFRLVLLRKGGSWGFMFTNRTSVQNVNTLLTWRFAPFKGFVWAQKEKPLTSHSLTPFPFQLAIKFANKSKFGQKMKSRISEIWEHWDIIIPWATEQRWLPRSFWSYMRRLESCWLTRVFAIPHKKRRPTKGLYFLPEPSTPKEFRRRLT